MGQDIVTPLEVIQLRTVYSLIEEICYRANIVEDNPKDPAEWHRDIVRGFKSSSLADMDSVVRYLANYDGKDTVKAREDLFLLTRGTRNDLSN
jgi:hypothetical protein